MELYLGYSTMQHTTMQLREARQLCIRSKRFTKLLFRDAKPVHICSVYEIAPQVKGALQYLLVLLLCRLVLRSI